MIGTKVGSYKIVRHLARGGMGDVYIANHELMNREAVAKVLHPRLSRDKKMVSRFLNDARAAASIEHPGIVEMFDSGYTEDDQAFIVMEKLRGETLGARIATARPDAAKALAIVRQLAGVLSAAHERGIVHRDLKPENIFVVPDPDVPGGERVKVLDFGIAKLAQDFGVGSVMTLTGAMFGTPAYMSPEQSADSAAVDHRADLYALGCILYEMLTGEPPFGRGGIGLVAAHLHDDPPPLSDRGVVVAPEVEAIVRTLLEKDPADRFASSMALVAAIDEVSDTAAVGAWKAVPQAQAPSGPAEGVFTELPTEDGGGDSDSDGDGDSGGGSSGNDSGGGSAADSGARTGPRLSSFQAASARPALDTAGMATPHDPASAGAWTQGAEADLSVPVQMPSEPSAKPRRGRGVVVAAVAIVLLTAGGAAAYVSLIANPKTAVAPPAVDAAVGAGQGAADAAPAREEADEGEVSADPEADEPLGEVATLLREVEDALEKEKYDDALGLLRALVALAPDDPHALELQSLARRKWTCEVLLRQFRSAVEGPVEKAVGLYASISDDPECELQARDTFESLRDAWLADREVLAKRLLKRKKCGDLGKLAKEAGRHFPGSEGALEAYEDRCRGRRARVVTRTGAKPAPAPPAGAETDKPASGPGPDAPPGNSPGSESGQDAGPGGTSGEVADGAGSRPAPGGSTPGGGEEPVVGTAQPPPDKGSTRPPAGDAGAQTASLAGGGPKPSGADGGDAAGDGHPRTARQQLSQDVVWVLLSQADSRMRRCARIHNTTGKVEIWITIMPTGKVSTVNAKSGTLAFKRCLTAALRATAFPQAKSSTTAPYLLDLSRDAVDRTPSFEIRRLQRRRQR